MQLGYPTITIAKISLLCENEVDTLDQKDDSMPPPL